MKETFENTICRAIDLLADGKNNESEVLLENCIVDIKKNIADYGETVDNLYAWGMCLSIMEEHEQALLKFESVLKKNPDHQDAWWRTASTLFYHLEEAESAKHILEKKLIKLYPDEEEYQSALVDVNSYLKRTSHVSKKVEKASSIENKKN